MRATIIQLAAFAGKSERTVRRYLSSGKWPHTVLPGGLIEIDDSLIEPESEQGAILASLARIEEKLDKLSASVDSLPAQPLQSVQQPARPAPVRLHTEQAEYTVRAAPGPAQSLPGGLVSWRSFANLHGISEGTARKAIDSGRLQIVEGEWRVGKVLTRGALDAAGRASFYTLYHSNPHWQDCTECPHR